jgi:hypothetical protein
MSGHLMACTRTPTQISVYWQERSLLCPEIECKRVRVLKKISRGWKARILVHCTIFYICTVHDISSILFYRVIST